MAVETENQREMDARDDILRGSLRGAIAGLFSTTLSVLKSMAPAQHSSVQNCTSFKPAERQGGCTTRASRVV